MYHVTLSMYYDTLLMYHGTFYGLSHYCYLVSIINQKNQFLRKHSTQIFKKILEKYFLVTGSRNKLCTHDCLNIVNINRLQKIDILCGIRRLVIHMYIMFNV